MDYTSLAEELLGQLIKNSKLEYHRDAEDFSQGEMRILSYLYFECDGECSCKLCRAIGMTTPRLSAALSGLERKNLIERITDADDRRRIHVYITAKGRDLVLSRRKKAIALIGRTLEALGEADAKEYVRIMEKITDMSRV